MHELKIIFAVGLFILAVGIVQAVIYGYAAPELDYYLKFFEQPMDKIAFGFILGGVGLALMVFCRKFRYLATYERRLALFAIFFTVCMRMFWEIHWITGAYYPSVYTTWSVLNGQLPTYPSRAFPALDYATNAWYHFNVVFPLFAISLCVVIFILLTIVVDVIKRKK
jgi:hypothetical protein